MGIGIGMRVEVEEVGGDMNVLGGGCVGNVGWWGGNMRVSDWGSLAHMTFYNCSGCVELAFVW